MTNFDGNFTIFAGNLTSLTRNSANFARHLSNFAGNSTSSNLFFYKNSFQGLKDWGENNANAGWDAEEEDVTDILREHRRMRKMNAVQ